MLDQGIYLAHRWENAYTGINLYYLPDSWVGFFAEIEVDDCDERFVVRSSFQATRLLEPYVRGVRLPEGWA